jgi:hypothetical protein
MSYRRLNVISRSGALALGLILSLAFVGAKDAGAAIQICMEPEGTTATYGELVDFCDAENDRQFSFVFLPTVAEDVILGDADHSGAVDLADFMEFQLCYGLRGDAVGDACAFADFDNDADIDLADFGQFQLSYGGPGLVQAKDLSGWVDCADCQDGETYLNLNDSELLLPVGMIVGESIQAAAMDDHGRKIYVVVLPGDQVDADSFSLVTTFASGSGDGGQYGVDASDSGDMPLEDSSVAPDSDDVIVILLPPDVGGGTGGGPITGGGGLMFFFGGEGGDPIFGGGGNRRN